MSKEDLIPLNRRNKQDARMIQRMGGATKSPQKKNAAKWREIKKKMLADGATDKDIQWMLERMENRDAMAVDIIRYIEEIRKDVHPAQRVALANTMIAAGKFQHGEKAKVDLNVSGNVTFIVGGVTNTIEPLKPDIVDAEFEEVKEDDG